MTVEKILLNSGKEFNFPSMFVELKYASEGRILRELVVRYSKNLANGSIDQIEGIMISIKKWEEISKFIFLGYISNEPTYKLTDRILLMDPSLHLLFTGTESDKISLLDAINASKEIRKTVNNISAISSQKEKTNQKISRLYPLLDSRLIRDILEYQIMNGTDILISPSTPVTSLRRIDEQIEKTKEMNRVSKILLDTVFSGVQEEKDLMHLLSLRLSVLKPDYIDLLKEALLINNPDHIGIRVMSLYENNPSQIWAFLRFIEELSKTKIPIHIFNVREFGYIALCYGANTITTPIAADPYFIRGLSDEAPPRRGAYYHPIDMTNDTYELLLEKTRSNNYKFPCHCEICKRFEKIIKIDKDNWNEFRRIHFLLVKNMEMKELRETQTPLKISLKDKIARAQQTVWLPYLD